MNNIQIYIPDVVNDIIAKLNNENYEAYICGGAVRDSLMNKTPHDWDICTSATPEEIMEVFKGEEIIPTGLQHGTVTLVIDKTPFEITTFRIEGEYSDSRHPDDVEFTTDIIKDLSRRDFTINAMAYHPEKGLIDPFNGYKDIQRRIIQTVGKAEERFQEDPLRILRAIRFSLRMKFAIHYYTAFGIKNCYSLLENISRERITSEINQMIIYPYFHREFSRYDDVFSFIIPELANCIMFNQNNPYHIYNVYDHTSCALSYAPNDLITKLALLFHDIGKPQCRHFDDFGVGHFHGHAKISSEIADNRLKELKYDNETRKKVVELVSYHDVTFVYTEKEIKKCVKRWLNKIGEEQFRRLLNVRLADVLAQAPEYALTRINNIHKLLNALEEVLKEKDCFTLKNLSVNGNDLITFGIPQGKELGEILTLLLNKVIDGELENKKEVLLDYALEIKDYFFH